MGQPETGPPQLHILAELVAWLPVAAWIGWLVVLAGGIAILVKASDVFTDSAETFGVALRLPHFIVGVTIIAFGTSLPELVSSVLAVLRGASEIAAGNVVGSNIANLLLILGLAAVIDRHLRIRHKVALVDLPFLLGATFLLALILWSGSVSRIEALLLLAALAIYLHHVLTQQRDAPGSAAAGSADGLLRPGVLLPVSGFFIYLGAEGTVIGVIGVAAEAGIGEEVIASSAVAFGTSLPEVSVTIAAARRGNVEMAVGNVIGSNILNALAVTGVAAMVGPVIVPAPLIAFGLPVMLVATLLAYLMIMKQEITRWEGLLLLLFYIYFIGELFGLI